MGVLQRRFPAVIDALSSPQVCPRWFEALGKQDRVLRFLQLGNTVLLLSGFGQEALLCSSCFGSARICPKQNRLALVSSRLHHWLRLLPVPILKEQSSRPLLRIRVFVPYGN